MAAKFGALWITQSGWQYGPKGCLVLNICLNYVSAAENIMPET